MRDVSGDSQLTASELSSRFPSVEFIAGVNFPKGQLHLLTKEWHKNCNGQLFA